MLNYHCCIARWSKTECCSSILDNLSQSAIKNDTQLLLTFTDFAHAPRLADRDMKAQKKLA